MDNIISITRESFESTWHQIAASTADAFGLDPEQKLSLMNHVIARHIVLIPFISGSPTPERDACSSLAVYLLSIQQSTKHLYLHIPEDNADPLQRLSNLCTYSGGSKIIQKTGIAILAMNMVLDYSKDRERDAMRAKYNPLNAQKWEEQEVLDSLKKIIEPYEDLFSSWDSYYEVLDPIWDNTSSGEEQFGKKAL